MADVAKAVTVEIPNTSRVIRMTRRTHNSLIDLVKEFQRLGNAAEMTEFRTKLEIIDRAYYTFSADGLSTEDAIKDELIKSGVQFEIPIILSQVDTMAAFFMEVFLDTYPLFPVVPPPGREQEATQLEAIIDDHAIRSRSARQLLLFLGNCAKYNFGVVSAEWSPIGRLQVETVISSVDEKPKIISDTDKINRILNIDPYNVLWDFKTVPADVAEKGDYIGWNEVISRTRLKGLIAVLTRAQDNIFNVKEAFESSNASEQEWEFYHEKPSVSRYVNPIDRRTDHTNWLSWATLDPSRQRDVDYKNSYLITYLYARIIPNDHALAAPEEKTPQVWRFLVINNAVIISAKKMISPLDMMPCWIGQPQEDGFSTQTRSIGEQGLVTQDVVSELINIRLNGSRRSLNDRALYDPQVFDPTDINSKVPSAKIPMKMNLKGVDIRNHYMSIPFDDRGTAGAMADVQTMIQLNEFLGSINSARQGQFRKGNRTLGEFNEIISNSELRSRMAALQLEYQVFVPLKEVLKANIFQFVTAQEILTQGNEVVQIDPEKLRAAILAFKVADGHTSREMIASADTLQVMFQTAAAIPAISEAYDLPAIFGNVMAVLGVRDITKFKRQPQLEGQPDAGTTP